MLETEPQSRNPLVKGTTTGVTTGMITVLMFGPVGIPVGLVTGALHALMELNNRDQKRLEIERMRLNNQVRTTKIIFLGLLSITVAILVGCGLIATRLT